MSKDTPSGLKIESLASLAVPSILTNLSFSIVMIVQMYFIADLGTSAVAAVGIGQRIFFGTQAILMAISTGTTALVARNWGARNRSEANKITVLSLGFACIVGLASSIPLIIWSYPVATIFDLDPHTTALAAENIRWQAVFNLSFAVSFILSAALRAAGDAWTPLWMGIAMNAINIPLLYLLVPGNAGFPAWGVAGAAIAGGVSGTIATGVGFVLYLCQKFRVKFIRRGWYSKQRFIQLIDVGYPAGIEMIVFQLGYFAFLIVLAWRYGTDAVAAYNLGGAIFMLCMVIGFGFSIAGATLAGQHLGAKDPIGAKRSGWRSLGYAILSMGSVAVVLAFTAEVIARIFLAESIDQSGRTIEYVSQIAWLIAIGAPCMAVEFAIGGALRGAGDTRFLLKTTMIGLLTVRVGIAALCLIFEIAVIWLFAATTLEYALKALMLLVRFQREKWQSLPQFDEKSTSVAIAS